MLGKMVGGCEARGKSGESSGKEDPRKGGGKSGGRRREVLQSRWLRD